MKQRFVLRYEGRGTLPAVDVQAISSLSDLRLVAQTPRMLLVESEEGPLRRVVRTLGSWVMSPETFLGHGDPRPRPERES